MINSIKYRVLRFLGYKTQDEIEFEEEHSMGDAAEEVMNTDKIMKELIDQLFWYRQYDNTYHPHKTLYSEEEIEIYLTNAKFKLLQNELRRMSK